MTPSSKILHSSSQHGEPDVGAIKNRPGKYSQRRSRFFLLLKTFATVSTTLLPLLSRHRRPRRRVAPFATPLLPSSLVPPRRYRYPLSNGAAAHFLVPSPSPVASRPLLPSPFPSLPYSRAPFRAVTPTLSPPHSLSPIIGHRNELIDRANRSQN